MSLEHKLNPRPSNDAPARNPYEGDGQSAATEALGDNPDAGPGDPVSAPTPRQLSPTPWTPWVPSWVNSVFENGGATRPHFKERRSDFAVVRVNHIASVLRRLRDQHAFVGVQIQNESVIHASAMLSVNDDTRTCVLDELADSEAHKRIRPITTLRLMSHLSGARVNFVSEVIALDPRGSFTPYSIRFPDVLLYEQRRDFYRVPVPDGLQVGLSMPGDDGAAIQGYLNDLSVVGVGITIPEGLDDRWEPGTQLEGCELRLPSGERLRCGLEIRQIQTGRDRRILGIGGRIHQMTRADRRRLERFAIELQRIDAARTSETKSQRRKR